MRAPERDVDASENVKLEATFPYENESADFFSGGTDIAFSGKYVYAMQQGMANGGVHVIQNGAKPKKLSFIPCPGEQNDVTVVKPGLIALGYHESTCAGVPGGGIRLIDVKNPKRPKFLGSVNDLPGGTHTLTAYPGGKYIYASPGGLPTNGGAVEQIIDVSDPRKPKVAATFAPNKSGCHDFEFWFSGKTQAGFLRRSHRSPDLGCNRSAGTGDHQPHPRSGRAVPALGSGEPRRQVDAPGRRSHRRQRLCRWADRRDRRLRHL